MDTLTILKDVRKLLNSPKRWIKWELKATGKDGKPSYCLVGAIGQVTKGDAFDTDIEDTARFAKAINLKSEIPDDVYTFQSKLIDYNNRDSLKYGALIKRIDRAIARLRK